MKSLLFALLALLLLLDQPARPPVASQTRERVVRPAKEEVEKVDVDLVVLDALVLQRQTGRVVGDLKRDDFVLWEDGVKQQITHFGQDTLPLSVVLLIDRGGCLDPYGSEVRRAALDAVERLKPSDEVAVMSYHNTVEVVEGFTRDRERVADALARVPPHDEQADHCLNVAFYKAADYMMKAGNPVGRRVIVVLTGVTSNFDCPGPSSAEARHAVFESGSVVCGIIPKSAGQRVESGVMRMATHVGGLFRVRSVSVNKMAEETGGEVLKDKPEQLDRAFNTLMEHLRTRYNMGFVPSNRRRDGTLRKLKVELAPSARKTAGEKPVVKTRRGYIAPRGEAVGVQTGAQ